MKEVTLLMAGTNYEGCTVLAVFEREKNADNAIEEIKKWHKNKPDLPSCNAPDSEWGLYDKYNKTFPFGHEYFADRYYKVKHEVR